MSTQKQEIQIRGFARSLVHTGLVSEEIIVQAQEESAKSKIPLVSWLVKKSQVAPAAIAQIGSVEFGIPFIDLQSIEVERQTLDMVDEKLTQTHRALPLFLRGQRLYVGISDPTNQQALKEIKFNTGLAVEGVLVEEDKLEEALEKASEAQSDAYGEMLEADLENIDVFGDSDDQGNLDELDVDDAPVVRYVNKILLDAINQGASDIHFEPYERTYRIRYRQDGILEEKAAPPINIASRLSARIKVMSKLNIAERRVPQDGRIKMKLSKKRSIDFRVNTCPTLYGEKIVLRILDSSSAQLGIDALGFEEDQKVLFEEAIFKPYGMILVTGPTGSGKTVSLYTALNILNDPDINISTAEDPVEIQVTGINQVNVNVATGLTFAEALRAFLRQDPDIVMVGEIRDLETAEIAVKAAQTGHLVLSTLHTNDAPQTLTRLANMGVPPFNIASSVNLILAQRLARRLCEKCKKPAEIPHEAMLEEGFTEEDIHEGLTIYHPVGCEACNNGYKGRVGIFEVLPVSEGIGQLIMENGNSIELKERALREGKYYDLRAAGLRKVKAGVTSLEELNRVTKD
ncbi:MAG: type IV-A pilus assembly ATPase PilB [bacterium]